MDCSSHQKFMTRSMRWLRHKSDLKASQTVYTARAFACSVLCLLACMATAVEARQVAVYDGTSLHRALRTAQPGDDIVLYPGFYRGVKTESPEDRWHYFYSHRSGTANAPITVRSYSRIDLQQLSGSSVGGAGYVFYLTGNHWRIRDLEFHTGQKGIMLDSASNNVFDNIAVYNVRDEGVHFRSSSSSNVLRNCLIRDTGRLKPGFGEAVYVGSHEGDRSGDRSNNNRIGGCQLGPGVTAEAIDIKAGTVNTIVERNVMNGRDTSGVNFADSFIDIKGDRVFIRYNRMNWSGNWQMDHGIHILRRQHTVSNIYGNTVTLGSSMPFLKTGQGTVHARNNALNYGGPLATTYGSGVVDDRLDRNLPGVHSYTGFRGAPEEPEPEPTECLQLDYDKKVEIDRNAYSCVDFPVDLSGRLLQVWDSNENKSCNFRGNIVVVSTGAQWSINANYAGTRNLAGKRVRVAPTNGCPYLIMRWL